MAGNTVNWSSTDDALSAALGFAETEDWDDVTEDTLIATSAHLYGWYPGVISYGTSSGTGVVGDSRWVQEWPMAKSISGSGEGRIVVPSRPVYRRTVDFDLIKAAEVTDVNRGIHALQTKGMGKVLRWYEDRDDGTVASPGTQADPHDAASGDYWEVMLQESPVWQNAGNSNDYYRTTLQLLGLPD